MDDDEVGQAWQSFVDALGDAGRELAAAHPADADEWELADGYRALLRGLGNQLGRFEVDRDRPELVPFNGWRQKFFMDNPDVRYWVADLRAGSSYVLRGARGHAAYLSITAYAPRGSAGAVATARIDVDDLELDAAGGYELSIGPGSGDGGRPHLELSDDTTVLWVRHFLDDPARDDPTTDDVWWCRIDVLDEPPAPAPIEPARFAHELRRLSSTMSMLPPVFAASSAADLEHPNELRRWTQMTGGAAYTEPGIEYLRGGWRLDPGEALVVEGEVPECRWWDVVLHSRHLNSLD